MTARSNQLTIECVGVHALNKGATLMLEAAVTQLRARLPDARLVGSWQLPAELRGRLGLGQTWPSDHLPLMALPRALKARLAADFVPRGEIDVILDMSGFAYGDAWPLEKLQHRLLKPLRNRRAGRPLVVLLPQAFGPFTGPGFAEDMGEALGQADLVFARDAQSLAHLRALDPEGKAALFPAPDFTNLLVPEKPSLGVTSSDPAGPAWVIPNAKIVAHGQDDTRAVYLEFLQCAVAQLRQAGRDPQFLIHEGAGDRALAEAVCAQSGEDVPIIAPSDTLEAKQLIAGGACVVSSRFHGLVSALSSGVPALACGWSHKYGALMGDYGLEAMQVDLAQPDSWAGLVTQLAQMGESERAALAKAAAAQKEASRAMWERVFATIEKAA